jgi:hypothetical protein
MTPTFHDCRATKSTTRDGENEASNRTISETLEVIIDSFLYRNVICNTLYI